MDLLVGQAPYGVTHNLTVAQFDNYTHMGIQKAELFILMTNDRDI